MRVRPEDRFELIADAPTDVQDDFAGDFRRGMLASPREISCRWFYDAVGSELFEQICALDEYYPTRAETEILRDRAAEIVAHCGPEPTFVELGSGSAVKTRHLIRASLDAGQALTYVPVDISRTALEQCCHDLLDAEPRLQVIGIAGEYARGMQWMADNPAREKLVLWMGSNIGNLDRDGAHAFLEDLRRNLSPADHVLLGIDLRKDRAVLERAYDDSRGVTAAFNRNVLARANRELGADFDLDAFAHVARYDDDLGRVTMHLQSQRTQTVHVAALDLVLDFTAGEAIHTEDSYKYSPEEIDAVATRSGFAVRERWFDGERRFSVNLLALRSW